MTVGVLSATHEFILFSVAQKSDHTEEEVGEEDTGAVVEAGGTAGVDTAALVLAKKVKRVVSTQWREKNRLAVKKMVLQGEVEVDTDDGVIVGHLEEADEGDAVVWLGNPRDRNTLNIRNIPLLLKKCPPPTQLTSKRSMPNGMTALLFLKSAVSLFSRRVALRCICRTLL